MDTDVTGKRIAMLVTTGFEQSELVAPRRVLGYCGADVEIVSTKRGHVRAWNRHDWGAEFPVDRHIDDVSVDEYDALLLPGGVMSPDYLRMDTRAVSFVRNFVHSGKLVAAICHGPWLLAEADVVRGRRVTSFPSLRTDLVNALADWIDAPVVRDFNLLTSRRPDDIADFTAAILDALEHGVPIRPATHMDISAEHEVPRYHH